jgi:glucose-1-phosphate adenylyltransferase
MAVKTVELDEKAAESSTIFYSDENGTVTDVLAFPKKFKGTADVSLNISVINRTYLQQMVMDAIAHGYTSMTKDIILRNLNHNKFAVYKYDGYFACIRSFADYFKYNMDLINDPEARKSLFNVRNRPIYTKVRNSVPTYFSSDSIVRNSMIADGCRIEGTVENSILFRGVKVSRNATVKNSIIMQDTYIGEGSYINCVVSDKNAFVRDGRLLSGTEEQPYFISKKMTL